VSMTYVGVPDRSLHIADYMLDTVLRSSDDDVRRMIEDFKSSDVAARNNAYLHQLIRGAEEEEEEHGEEQRVAGPINRSLSVVRAGTSGKA